ncbi:MULTISPECIES: ATP-binding protein [Thermomonosporaceae]|uniref:ATP-binding protein n=1 Tax=Thermomonosporaceae TaxID=2012 RepID=UPI00255A84F5|nr:MULTISPECIES: ATP-binding protein [Thermomonosporaceae]MDL4773842.1 ATP-binding protein [Actinomadura xylanilytica]
MEELGEQVALHGGRDEGQAARRTVRERAAKVISDATVLDDIELMSAEAIANAVLHGSGVTRVSVSTDGHRVRVEVRDDGPGRADLFGRGRIDHGRGLAVIDALSTEWGLEQTPRQTHLWFEVDVQAGPAAI